MPLVGAEDKALLVTQEPLKVELADPILRRPSNKLLAQIILHEFNRRDFQEQLVKLAKLEIAIARLVGFLEELLDFLVVAVDVERCEEGLDLVEGQLAAVVVVGLEPQLNNLVQVHVCLGVAVPNLLRAVNQLPEHIERAVRFVLWDALSQQLLSVIFCQLVVVEVDDVVQDDCNLAEHALLVKNIRADMLALRENDLQHAVYLHNKLAHFARDLQLFAILWRVGAAVPHLLCFSPSSEKKKKSVQQEAKFYFKTKCFAPSFIRRMLRLSAVGLLLFTRPESQVRLSQIAKEPLNINEATCLQLLRVVDRLLQRLHEASQRPR